ncbi:hypothetical protein CU669_05115 [Paramagnetospirillum kuznetsovii]|uniref:EF-hand domain-containing protein n=1 Tax=Paramagnetospirillum kuznetsovii TaxID=2053833 RepID=A0A364P0A9_9PROT|nr:EF-hand domain-containing protein [Paramagnetospirillum kuznetsovii]RAU22772.1 hypothetical protein CU669_05115 [Paramagnetospirillum kuznetsovii]
MRLLSASSSHRRTIMLQGIGSSGSENAYRLSKMISSLDTNNDKSVSKSEFVAGKPKNVSDDQAGSLFDALDSSGTGSMNLTDLLSSFQQMASTMQSTLIQAQSDSGNSDSGNSGIGSVGHHHGPPDASEMFAKLDADGDGTVTRDEFVAGRPDNVSEADANSFFDKVSGSNGDSLTQTQLAEGLKSAGPPGGPPPGVASSSSASSSSTSSSDDPGELLDKLLAALQSPDSQAASTSGGGEAQLLLQQFVKAVSSYQNTAYQTRFQSGTSVAA